jgi:hypothetical protein
MYNRRAATFHNEWNVFIERVKDIIKIAVMEEPPNSKNAGHMTSINSFSMQVYSVSNLYKSLWRSVMNQSNGNGVQTGGILFVQLQKS